MKIFCFEENNYSIIEKKNFLLEKKKLSWRLGGLGFCALSSSSPLHDGGPNGPFASYIWCSTSSYLLDSPTSATQTHSVPPSSSPTKAKSFASLFQNSSPAPESDRSLPITPHPVTMVNQPSGFHKIWSINSLSLIILS